MKFKPLSILFLSLEEFCLMAVGLYFVFLRSPLLPEDYRYINSETQKIQSNIPGLGAWLGKVFLVVGFYIFTTGLFTVYVAQSSFRLRTKGALAIIIISGLTSIVSMTIINFIIQSDFKWVLLTFTFIWITAVILYLSRK